MASDNATAFSGGGSTFLSDPGIYLAHPDGNVSSEMVTNLTNVSGVESWSPGPAKHPRWMMAPPSAMTPDILTLITIREHLDKTIPYFLSLGILGNIVAACTFLLTPLKKNSLSHYLTALAIADIINLAACMVTWLSKQGLELYTKVGVCQVTSFALLMSRFLTVWYLLSAHVERLLVHCGRPGNKQWCTVFRTKCIILTVFILSLVAFLHYIWSHVVMFRAGRTMCVIMEEITVHINRLRRVEIVMAQFLPMLMMVAMDVALICIMLRKLFRRPAARRSPLRKSPIPLKKKSDRSLRSTSKDYANAENGELRSLSRRTSTGRKQNGVERGTGENPQEPSLDLSAEKSKATILCMLAGLVFMALTFPSAYLRARINFSEQRGRAPLTMYEIHLMQVFEQIVLFNGVYKIPMYLLFLRTFRKAVWYLFTCICRKNCCKKEAPAVTTV